MIFPKQPQSVPAVAAHYDELDSFYREIWGDHVHHGYWTTGRESARDAVAALVELVARRLDLVPGQQVCDIGCGYGATARQLANRHAVDVTGVTVSAAQAAYAEAAHPGATRASAEAQADLRPQAHPQAQAAPQAQAHPQAQAAPRAQAHPQAQVAATGGVTILRQDWLANRFAAAAFDRAYAIESSEHMADKQGFFDQAFRTLKPGGRLVVCAWLARTAPREWEVRSLLEPICREGRLPSMGDEADYRGLAARAGFVLISLEDLSVRVRRTWWICVRRSLGKLVTRSRYRRFLFDRTATNRRFAVTLPRILLAYRTGSMRYCLLVFSRPDA